MRQELAALQAQLRAANARLDALLPRLLPAASPLPAGLPPAPLAPAPVPTLPPTLPPPLASSPAPSPLAPAPTPVPLAPALAPAPEAPPPPPEAPAPPAEAAARTGSGPLISMGANGDAVVRLQDRLRELGSDPGATDGAFGPLTDAAVRDFQARNGLAVDGVVGPQTWGALGIVVEEPAAPAPPDAAPAPAPAPAPAQGHGPLLHPGAQGPAVVALQDRLRALGFDPGGSDGAFGPLTDAAVRAFQASRGLEVDGVVGPATWGALGIAVDAPVSAPGGATVAPIEGWRGAISQHYHAGGGHPGVDIAVPAGTPIRAVKDGTVIYAQFNPGGYGNLAVIQHGDGTFSLYAHQSALNCGVGQAVAAGQVIGAVGSTGNSTGPHLHFEVRQGGNVWSSPTIDPESYLGGA